MKTSSLPSSFSLSPLSSSLSSSFPLSSFSFSFSPPLLLLLLQTGL
jgi:hypothetical protein